jgi:hypothetical protein
MAITLDKPEFICRSRLGYLRLNSPRVLIVDNDVKPFSRDYEHYFLSLYEKAACKRLHFRVYRTHGGLRGILTNKLLGKNAALEALWDLGCDSDYINFGFLRDGFFCGRITPKPSNLHDKFNLYFNFYRLNAKQKQNFLEEYSRLSVGRASSHFLYSVGGDTILPEIQPVVDFYDNATAAFSELALA